jgi:hypothetical protein
MSNEQVVFFVVLVTAILLLIMARAIEQHFVEKRTTVDQRFMLSADKLYHYFGILRYCEVNEHQLAKDVSRILACVQHTSAGKYLLRVQQQAFATGRLPPELNSDDEVYGRIDEAISCVRHALKHPVYSQTL